MDKPVQAEPSRDLDRREEGSGAALSFTRTRLKVKDIMNPNVVTASPTERVFCAAERMCSHRVSCVVVLDKGNVVGLLTQKDLLLGIAQEPKRCGQLPVAQYMARPVLVVPPDMSVVEAGLILKSRRIKHLPVVAQRRLVGIVTQTDITRGLIDLTPLQRVGKVMSPTLATVEEDTTVAGAAQTMSSQNISCVVVTRRHEPVGILTQKDILTRVILTQRSPTRTRVADVMSSPLLPIPPDSSVFAASRAMEKMGIHRLVVKDARRVCGIVSQTDILHAVERRLAEEERYRLLLVRSDIPIFMLDATGVVTYVNVAFLRLFGRQSHEEMVGSVLSDQDVWSSPRDRERFLTVLEKGRSGLLRLVARTGAGRRERLLLLLAVARDGHGEIIGWQGVAWPMTGPPKRKKALCRNPHEGTLDAPGPGT